MHFGQMIFCQGNEILNYKIQTYFLLIEVFSASLIKSLGICIRHYILTLSTIFLKISGSEYAMSDKIFLLSFILDALSMFKNLL